MRTPYANEERQAEGKALGEQMMAQAWDWLAASYPEEQPTAYRRVFGALQMIVSAIPPEDEQMALAAIGSVLGSVSVQRPDLDVIRLVRGGFLGAVDAERQMRGTVQ